MTQSEIYVMDTLIAAFNGQSYAYSRWKTLDHPVWQQFNQAMEVLRDVIYSIYPKKTIITTLDTEEIDGVSFTWEHMRRKL